MASSFDFYHDNIRVKQASVCIYYQRARHSFYIGVRMSSEKVVYIKYPHHFSHVGGTRFFRKSTLRRKKTAYIRLKNERCNLSTWKY